ncbi:lysozyme inhibitor LprI family protein [Paraburkholderia sp. HD33-4]|uniref:lysozyme inhibitor LprI family protein n=1 Tax=Paraburkholderia sp. HD33-4 TaxID=2883242 RepID=UPI001F19561F|nr:hypothetical protein [Paraburkholderia sp. HD33-4]
MTLFRPLLIAGLLLAHPYANATSFDCQRGRSPTERMICGDSALSTLDDTLGQLYWKARRRVAQRRAFIDDSDSKWAWREANCRDAACLRTWYATRIDELQRLLASLSSGARHAVSVDVDGPAPSDPSTLQCTAAKPGLVVNDQCASVIGQSGKQWKYQPRDADWFCGVATLEAPDIAPSHSQSATASVAPAPLPTQWQPQVQASAGQ